METPPAVQGESEEHFTSLPIGHHRLLKNNVRALFFLRTQLNRKQINKGGSLAHLKSNKQEMRLHSPHEWRGCNCAHLSGTQNCWWDCHTHLWELSAECAAAHRSAPEWRNGRQFWFWREPPSLKQTTTV